MMAADSHRFPAGFIALVLFLTQVSLAYPRASNQTEEGVTPPPPPPPVYRRGVCADGTYEHGGKNCCLCGTGQQLERHCSMKPDDGVCIWCPEKTYSSHPNSKETCEPCTSCGHANANLEVYEPCTVARDTKCGCKKDHYCSGGVENCFVCHPCKECGPEGVRVACSIANNTVCNDRTEDAVSGAIIGLIVSIVFIILVLIAVVTAWRWKTRSSRRRHHLSDSIDPEKELQPLNDHYLPDIALALGWKEMRNIALRSKVSKNAIEACELDHPNDSQERTIHLLQNWIEMQGRGASGKLVRLLQETGNKSKAEDVAKILRHGDEPATSNMNVSAVTTVGVFARLPTEEIAIGEGLR